jgi:hypothetical protein
MACGLGLPDAIDCATDHWCKALKKFNPHREPNGQWRADCPVPKCRSLRAIEFDAPGKHVRWKTWCGHHDKETVRPYLAALIGPCMPGGSRRPPIRHDELIELALADLPPMTKNLRMLQLAGMGTQEALDKLGVRPDHRARVIGGRTGGTPRRARSRRS